MNRRWKRVLWLAAGSLAVLLVVSGAAALVARAPAPASPAPVDIINPVMTDRAKEIDAEISARAVEMAKQIRLSPAEANAAALYERAIMAAEQPMLNPDEVAAIQNRLNRSLLGLASQIRSADQSYSASGVRSPAGGSAGSGHKDSR